MALVLMRVSKPKFLRTAHVSSLAVLIILCVVTVSQESPPKSKIEVVEKDGKVRVSWPVSESETGIAVFSMNGEEPLIESLGVALNGREMKPILSGLNPVTVLTVGTRDLKNQAGWGAFFDNPPKCHGGLDSARDGEAGNPWKRRTAVPPTVRNDGEMVAVSMSSIWGLCKIPMKRIVSKSITS